jgi:hypothetical protein
MKKILLILLCLPMIGFGQLTMIPDANFEQKLIDLGYDSGTPNGSVYTALIDTVTNLDVSYSNIYDLTGIEDFTALTELNCAINQLTSLDVSNNLALTDLYCWSNQLTSLDVSDNLALTNLACHNNQLTTLDVNYNTALTHLHCGANQLASLDLSQNTALTFLFCWDNELTSLDLIENSDLDSLHCRDNKLTSLDVSDNSALIYFSCSVNLLTSLDLRNGNNMNMIFYTYDNPNLTCINVDDSTWSTNAWVWMQQASFIDSLHYFSNNCSTTGIQEHTKNKELLKVTDLLGRETKGTKNEVLFYIYDDGTVEKRIIIE